jgi:hypothetical protein
MKKNSEPMKALSFSMPLSLAEKVQDSAKENRRSFTKEVVWRLEKSFVGQEKSAHAIGTSTCAKVTTEDSLQLSS